MFDVRVVEAADDMHDRVRVPDIGQELVAQPFPFRGALYQAGDVREFKGGIDDLFRMEQFHQIVHSLIRHFHHADIRGDGRERIVLRQHLAVGDGVEQGGLADVRQSDNSCS